MIPQDLRTFLSEPANRTITCTDGEVRQAELFGPDELVLRTFNVRSYALFTAGLLSTDIEENREYQGYDLIKSCPAYDPEGILIWFPDWNQYGSWDCDHHSIITYPDATWTDIAKDPTWYVNGQWYPEQVKHVVVNPWA